jgi:hypothetical protein
LRRLDQNLTYNFHIFIPHKLAISGTICSLTNGIETPRAQ